MISNYIQVKRVHINTWNKILMGKVENDAK